MNNESKYLLIFVAAMGLVYLLSPVLMPFLSAGLLAYLGNPLVCWLEKHKWSRSLAVTFVFVVIFSSLTAVVVILVPLIEQQVSALVEKLPAIIAWLKGTVLPWLQVKFSSFGDVEQLQATLKNNLGGASKFAINALGSLTSSSMAFFAVLANLILIPVVSFYFLRDWSTMVEKLHDAFPRRMETKLTIVTQEIDTVLGAFFKGQVLVMLSLAIIYFIGLSLAGLEFALLISLLLGLVSFVPYLGLIIGLVLACSASVFQLHDTSGLMAILLVFAVVQILESVVLTPLLVGDKIGLHPVAVIFAVMAGGQLFGFTGVLLALPVAAVLLVLLRHVNDQYKSSELYTKV